MKKVYVIIGLFACMAYASCMGHKTDASNVTDSTNLAQDISTDSGGVRHDSSKMKKNGTTVMPKDSGPNSKSDSVKAIKGNNP